eukprot:TRINITY_DN6215_c0_g1_i5.p1 TRINITY_DN6215_c0_g1~~TRINITY_DN6215_c0_g1_i5.p1  ORF type:complete len:315 (+),score=61.26 TRINITY_DN6215_c0_g1_i5:345-1289(+)
MEKIRSMDIISIEDFLSKDFETLRTSLSGEQVTELLAKLQQRAVHLRERFNRKFLTLFEDPTAPTPAPRRTITLFDREGIAMNKVETQVFGKLNEAIALGELTEIAGFPGLGKTTLCLQIVRNFVRQYEREGFEAIIYDCDGGVVASRLWTIFKGNKAQLSRVYIRRITATSEFEELRQELKRYLKQNKMLKLVVIDSIASHFRLGREAKAFDVGPEAHDLANSLRRIARRLEVGIVVTHPCASDSSKLAPRLVLGDAFSAQVASRLTILSQRKARMTLNVEKTPANLHLPDAPLWAGEVGFVITESGLTPMIV